MLYLYSFLTIYISNTFAWGVSGKGNSDEFTVECHLDTVKIITVNLDKNYIFFNDEKIKKSIIREKKTLSFNWIDDKACVLEFPSGSLICNSSAQDKIIGFCFENIGE